MKLYPLVLAWLFASASHAQTGDWARLQTTRHHPTLIVETGVNPYGPAHFDRCSLTRVDATTLTCTMLGDHKRIVFPKASIDAVYQVKQPWFPLVIACTTLGLFLGGLATANAPVFVLGVISGVIWFISASVSAAQRQIDVWTGASPDPFPDNEKRVLLYSR